MTRRIVNTPASLPTLVARTALACLALAAALPPPAAASEAAPVGVVTLRLLATVEGGPTGFRGTAAAALSTGETGRLQATAGVMRLEPTRCSTATGAGAPPRQSPATRLVGPGVSWDFEVSLAGPGADPLRIDVDWRRSPENGAAVPALAERQRIELAVGERRILDSVRFSHPGCDVEAYHLELVAGPGIAPELTGRALSYELWFARTREGRRDEFARTELAADQGEEARFRLTPLIRAVSPSGAGGADDIYIKSLCKGTVRAWLTGPEALTIQIEPYLEHSLHQASFRGSLSSGQGRKVFEARPGETIEIEMPPSGGQFLISGDEIQISGKPIPGVEARGDVVRVDVGRLLADTGYSLFVRVRVVD